MLNDILDWNISRIAVNMSCQSFPENPFIETSPPCLEGGGTEEQESNCDKSDNSPLQPQELLLGCILWVALIFFLKTFLTSCNEDKSRKKYVLFLQKKEPKTEKRSWHP